MGADTGNEDHHGCDGDGDHGLAGDARARQGRRPQGEVKKTEPKKPVVDEKAYKAALERIPDPKQKYDPWGVARPAEPAKKPK